MDAAATEELEQYDLAATHELEQKDRLSNLPDDILSIILERLKLREAARTSVLSRRWMHLFGLRSKIVIDTGAFCHNDDDFARSNANMVEATKSMLAHTSQRPISFLRVRFHLLEESIKIVRCVENAMANRGIAKLHFLMHSDIMDVDCTQDHLITYGRRFMRFFDAGPRAFGGLSYLHVQCLGLSVDDMANVLNTCNKLEHLYLHRCDYGFQSVLKIEHPQLTTITFNHCRFERVDLICLPRLTRLTCHSWTAPRDQYPLSFGYVPQLATLILSNPGTTIHKSIHLSQFLSNVMISVLDLDFTCFKIWIQPEAPKLVGPRMQNLQFLCLRRIHEECELDWTIFFLQAAPLLKIMHIQVWDHTSCGHEDDEPKEFMELCQQLYEKKSDLSWEAPDDLKHYSLKELTIKGYQDDDKFTRYIRRVVEAAVNLELIKLYDSGWCENCKFSPSTRYPRTHEERDLTRKQISQWRSSPIKIGIGA